ncbi:hypothetical protein [Halomonas sp. MES3-P3E]|uniref:hypothetical protein n=1 Tax=Halomonas sp. MES3-P3E TaxID=2058321 RepID=UPI000C3216E4|nr:hypothetical protein [Halomonas sp. MES3-P3E]PKG48408.1 hypothetical protein CXF87_18080 [Halomonas sp. MES3-P3E]
MSALYAPGARVVIRDCEWIVRRADASDDGGYILTVDGLSELVSGKSARFLTKLEEAENAIRTLNPAKARLEEDLTPGFEKSRLFIETQLRQITPQMTIFTWATKRRWIRCRASSTHRCRRSAEPPAYPNC